MSDPTTALTFVTVLGCALAAGVFFAFSSFVMQGLDGLAGARRRRDAGHQLATR